VTNAGGRELRDHDLFPLQHLNIECTHRGRKNGTAKPRTSNLHHMMDGTMTASTRTGPTRYHHTMNKEWIRRVKNVSSELVQPQVKEKIRTRKIINRLEEIALEKRDPTVREAIRKGGWKYRAGHFGPV